MAMTISRYNKEFVMKYPYCVCAVKNGVYTSVRLFSSLPRAEDFLGFLKKTKNHYTIVRAGHLFLKPIQLRPSPPNPVPETKNVAGYRR